MSLPKKNKPATEAPKITKESDIAKVIYADRILNVGFGPGVSRLTLGMETGTGTFAPTATLILPTPALLEAMNAVLTAINGDDDLKKALIKGSEALKDQLTALK